MIVLPASYQGRSGSSAASLQQGSAAGANHSLLSSLSEPLLSITTPSPLVDAVLRAALKPLSRITEGQQQQENDDFPDLHDDCIREVLAKLDGSNRQAASGCCKRLRDLACPTFTQMTLPVAPTTSCSRSERSEIAADATTYAVAAAGRLSKMTSVTLLLPPYQQGSKLVAAAADPTAAADQFLADCLPACPGGVLHAEVLRIKAAEAQSADAAPAPCQISYVALSKLAAATPRLRRLSLPLLSCPAAAALPLFSSRLTTLRLTVSDSPSLDHALQLKELRHLFVSTRKGLLYLVLSQRQIGDLAQMSNLQTLSLQNVLINDCRASWAPLAALSSLHELSVSSPLSAERLAQLPPSVRVLQLPFFSGSLEALARPDVDDGETDADNTVPAVVSRRGFGFGQPAELRCRQAFTEQDLMALARLPALATLQCDNVVIMDAAVGTAQAALARAAAMGAPAYAASQAAAEAANLPVLRSVTSLHLTGYHTASGLLGVLFPNLESLQVTSVTVPRPVPAHIATLPKLRSLNWPSSCVLPALLSVCPEVSSLGVTGINCQQRLEELVQMAPPPPSRPQPQQSKDQQEQSKGAAPLAAPATAAKAIAVDGYWWPAKLAELSLCFSSSVRFRPKQVVTTLSAMPTAVRQAVRSLVLRDQAQTSGPGRVVDDAVLAAALRALPALQSVSLTDCGAVTDAGLRVALSEVQHGLVSAVVAGCPKVSRSKFERTAGELGRPWLEMQWRAASD